MNNNEGFKITAHQPVNPFAGKKFKMTRNLPLRQ